MMGGCPRKALDYLGVQRGMDAQPPLVVGGQKTDMAKHPPASLVITRGPLIGCPMAIDQSCNPFDGREKNVKFTAMHWLS